MLFSTRKSYFDRISWNTLRMGVNQIYNFDDTHIMTQYFGITLELLIPRHFQHKKRCSQDI